MNYHSLTGSGKEGSGEEMEWWYKNLEGELGWGLAENHLTAHRRLHNRGPGLVAAFATHSHGLIKTWPRPLSPLFPLSCNAHSHPTPHPHRLKPHL